MDEKQKQHIEDLRKEVEAAEEVDSISRAKVLSEIAKVGAGAVTAGAALGAAIVAGDLMLFGGALTGAGMFVLTTAWDKVKARHREPDLDKVGPGAAIEMAKKAVEKPAHLRKFWINLLTNSLDPNFHSEIRKADITLLESLHTSDAVLMLMVGRHLVDMNKSWAAMPGAVHVLSIKQLPPQIRGNITNLHVLRTHYNRIIRGKLEISDTEMLFSLQERSDNPGQSKPDGLFTALLRRNVTGNELIDNINSSVLSTNLPPNDATNGLFAVALLPRAQRLVDLVVDEQGGF